MSLPALSTQAPAASEVELHDLFSKLANEAFDLACRSDGLQTLLADFTSQGFSTEQVMERLQEADALSQKLHDLAIFLRAITGVAPAGAYVDVAHASGLLLLSESVQRYGVAPVGPPPPAVEAGDLDLW